MYYDAQGDRHFDDEPRKDLGYYVKLHGDTLGVYMTIRAADDAIDTELRLAGRARLRAEYTIEPVGQSGGTPLVQSGPLSTVNDWHFGQPVIEPKPEPKAESSYATCVDPEVKNFYNRLREEDRLTHAGFTICHNKACAKSSCLWRP